MPSRSVVLSGLALLALATPAGATAGGWRTPDVTPLTAPASGLGVATDASGDALAVWTQADAGRSLWRPAAGPAQSPAVIGAMMYPQGAPQFDAAGNAYVAIIQKYGKPRLAKLAAGASSWTVSGELGTPVHAASLAVAPDGTVHMLTSDGTGALLLRVWAPGASVSSPTTEAAPAPAPGTTADDARLATDAGGHLAAAWVERTAAASDTATLRAARRGSSGTWDGAVTLDARTEPHGAGGLDFVVDRIAVSPAGAALLSWVAKVVDSGAGTTLTEARAAIAQVGVAFDPAATLESRTTDTGQAKYDDIAGTAAAFDGERAMVGWFGQHKPSGASAVTQDVRVAYRPSGAGQAFSTGPDMSSGAEQVQSLALIGRGGAGALAAAGTTGSVLASVGGPGATLPTASALISGQVDRSNVAATAVGADGVVLSSTDGVNPVLRLHVHDATPPVLGEIAMPSTATTGQALPFSGSATDTWQSVAPHFDFGDGDGETGTDVAHFYRAPGAYTVRVTATDDVGNTSAPVERAILVSPGPAPPAVTPPRAGLTNETFATVAFRRFLARARRDGTFGSADVVCASRGGCRLGLTVAPAAAPKTKSRAPTRSKSKPLVKSTISIAGGRTRRVAFRLRGRALQTLVAARRLKLALTLALRDGDGHTRTVRRSVTVRAPKG